MAKTGSTQKKVVKATSKKGDAKASSSMLAEPIKALRKDGTPYPTVKLEWTQNDKATEWIAKTTPIGEVAPARITMSGRNSDKSYSYFCYRDARAVAVRHQLADAKRACELGPMAKLSDAVLDYVTNHQRDIPMFLALTEKERRAVWAQYGYAAPAASRVQAVEKALHKRGVTRVDMSDPGTQKLLKELAAKEAPTPSNGGAAPKARSATKADRVAVTASPDGKLKRVKDGNPKKAGSSAFARWELLFKHADAGHTVKVFLADKGNPETLSNAVLKGYVAIEGGK